MKRATSHSEPLTKERICAAAIALIEEHGIDAFSTRKLGETLGCEAMSIYHHYPSKGDLLDAIASTLLGEVVLPARGAPLDRVVTTIRNYRALAQRRPQTYPLLAMRRLNTGVAFAFMEYLFGCFAELGFDPPMRAALFRLIGQWLNGVALSELAATSRVAHTTRRVLPEEIDFARYPLVRETTPFLLPAHFEDGFELGLATMIRTLEEAPRSLKRRRR